MEAVTARLDEQATQIQKVSAQLAAASPSRGGLEASKSRHWTNPPWRTCAASGQQSLRLVGVGAASSALDFNGRTRARLAGCLYRISEPNSPSLTRVRIFIFGLTTAVVADDLAAIVHGDAVAAAQRRVGS